MDIRELFKQGFDKALIELTKDPKEKDKDIPDNRKAYDGDHPILSDPARADKTVGDTSATQRVVKHAREPISYQELIVRSAVIFLFGKPVTLLMNNGKDEAFKLINDVWKQNKLDYFNKRLARDLFVECKAAELWFIPAYDTAKGESARIRVSLLSVKEGYKIYPHFDEFGDMDAFTILYDTTSTDGKVQQNVTIYTAESIIQAAKQEGGAWESEERQNLIGKIPVVYYEQDKPEWSGVAPQIDREEYLISNFADTNDYFGAPVLQTKGIVSNLPKKEDTGKVLEVQPETDEQGRVYYPGGAEFITWDRAPEAIEKEYNILKNIIYSMTQTPDLSFDNVKGMSAVSGIALRLMFSDALFKALDKQEIFGPALERRLSIMKSMIALTNSNQKAALDEIDIDIVFGDVLPQNIKEIIEALSIARGGEAIMSEESAVRRNPLVTDPEKDIQILENERATIKSFAGSYA